MALLVVLPHGRAAAQSSTQFDQQSASAEQLEAGEAGRHAMTFLAGSVGAALLTALWVSRGPNWDDTELREDMGYYVGAPMGAALGVWIEGERTGDVAWWAPIVGSLAGLAAGAAHAASTDGDSDASYAALLLLPPLSATILTALTEPETEEER